MKITFPLHIITISIRVRNKQPLEYRFSNWLKFIRIDDRGTLGVTRREIKIRDDYLPKRQK